MVDIERGTNMKIQAKQEEQKEQGESLFEYLMEKLEG